MIRKLLNGQSKTITSAAIILAGASFLSRFIGIIRERIFAHHFGAGDIMDAYVAAFRFPDLVYMLLVMGALSAGFIPVFGRIWEKSKKQSWELVNTVMNLLALVLIGVSILMIIFAPALAEIVAPGFGPKKLELTTMLMRIMFISPIILGISSVISGVLQTLKYFFIYALTPIFYNIGIIIGIAYLAPWLGPQGLALGVLLGAALHLVIQIPILLKTGFLWKPRLNLKSKDLHEIIRLMIPRMLGLGATQINIIIMTTIASTIAAGSVAVFHFANNLQSFPIGILGVSFAIAAFPTFVALINKGHVEKMVEHVNATTRQIIFLIVPITVLFLLLRAQITRVILGTGQFDWAATIATGDALAFFALSLFAQSLIPLINRAFYAVHNTKTPLYAGVIGIIVNIAAALYLKDILGISGIALAFSLGAVVQFALLWVALRLELGTLHEHKILHSFYKISVAGGVMAVLVQLVKTWIGQTLGTETFWAVFTQGLVAGLVGLVVYGLLLYVLRSPEMHTFIEIVWKKLFKEKQFVHEPPDSDNANG